MRQAPDAPDNAIVWGAAAPVQWETEISMPKRPLRTAILAIFLAAIPVAPSFASQTAGAPPPATAPQLRFDIAAGPMADALAAFESLTGLKGQNLTQMVQVLRVKTSRQYRFDR